MAIFKTTSKCAFTARTIISAGTAAQPPQPAGDYCTQGLWNPDVTGEWFNQGPNPNPWDLQRDYWQNEKGHYLYATNERRWFISSTLNLTNDSVSPDLWFEAGGFDVFPLGAPLVPDASFFTGASAWEVYPDGDGVSTGQYSTGPCPVLPPELDPVYTITEGPPQFGNGIDYAEGEGLALGGYYENGTAGAYPRYDHVDNNGWHIIYFIGDGSGFNEGWRVQDSISHTEFLGINAWLLPSQFGNDNGGVPFEDIYVEYASGVTGSVIIGPVLPPLAETFVKDGGVLVESITGDPHIIPNSWVGANLNIDELQIGNTCTLIGNSAFFFCSNLVGSLTIPNSVTTIESFAFEQCTGFNGPLTIPNSVTTIGDFAFRNCSGFDGTLTIPDSVTFIGEGAFLGCDNITRVEIYADPAPTIGSLAFANMTSVSSAVIHVPTGATGYASFIDGLTVIADL